ncbi:MAG: glutathione S-transferase family protein [Rhodobacteraceae bacterium]|nr:glutathione S-transferase family protein [Paracoccaceae bacterium]
MLEELGIDYEKVHVDMGVAAHRSADYRSKVPTMRVPALGLQEGPIVGETAAIMTLLGEQHPDAGLVPREGDADRGPFMYWLMAMATGGYPTFSRACHPEQFTTDDAANDAVQQRAEAHLNEFFDILESGIEGNPFFLKRGLTALDFYAAMLTEWVADRASLLESRPKLAALCEAVDGRPAYGRVKRDHCLRQETG